MRKAACVMNFTLFLEIVLIVSLSIVMQGTLGQDEVSCSLSNNRGTSTCIRAHRCDSFAAIFRQSAGNLSPRDKQYIQSHECNRKNFFCCPDNAKTTPPTTAQTSTLSQRSDLRQVVSHKNFALINDRKCGVVKDNDRILGGTEADLGAYPWMALLQYRDRLDGGLSYNCGGSLIAKRFVLTAAHCIIRDLVAVRLGEHRISTVTDCNGNGKCLEPVQDIPVDRRIRHSGFNSKTKTNDIGLLRLSFEADTSKKNVRTICLPTTFESQIEQVEVAARKKMLITGWGRTENGKQSDALIQAFIPYVTNTNCQRIFDSLSITIYDTFLCAGGVEGNRTDNCHGDSGGPIQTFGQLFDKNKFVQYGVVQGGVDCRNLELNYPGVYTNVAYYLTWMMDNMS